MGRGLFRDFPKSSQLLLQTCDMELSQGHTTSVETTWHLIESPEVAENPMHTNRQRVVLQNKSIPGLQHAACPDGTRPLSWDSVGRQLVSRFPCSVVGDAPRLVYDEEASWQEPRGLSGSQIWISSPRLNRWRKKSLAVTVRTDVRPGPCRDRRQMAFSGWRRLFWARIYLRRTLFPRRGHVANAWRESATFQLEEEEALAVTWSAASRWRGSVVAPLPVSSSSSSSQALH